MMLKALYELAMREKLLENPNFEKKKVDLFLRIDAAGKFLALEAAGIRLGQGQLIDVPRLPKRANNIAAGFLFDKAKYVLGIGKEGRTVRWDEHCAQAFQALVDRLAADTQDEGAMAVSRFLSRRHEQIAAVLAAYPFGSGSDWLGSEYIAFRYHSDNSIVHERDVVRAYWSEIRSRKSGKEGRSLTCLVTGIESAPTRLHPAVKRIPGSQTMGATLVSFSADTSITHGLPNSENAPVTRAAAEGYVTALNWLLEPSLSPPHRFRYGLAISEGAVVVFWTRDSSSVVDDLMQLLDEPEPGGHLRTGRPVAGPDKEFADRDSLPETEDTPFYAATLSGKARVIVRDWIETTAAAVRQNLQRYLSDLHIGAGKPQPVPLRSLLRSMEAPGRELPAALATRLVRAVLSGETFPRQLLSVALSRLCLPPDKYDERRLLNLRCGLIKAVLLRLQPSEVTVSLDEGNTRVSYLLGRLFAVLDNLQAAFLGNVNATIRDRFFGAASAAPALVFPRLLRLAIHHTVKSRRLDLVKVKSHILALLPAPPFPSTLHLEEQGLFAVGYYHQRERLFEKKLAK